MPLSSTATVALAAAALALPAAALALAAAAATLAALAAAPAALTHEVDSSYGWIVLRGHLRWAVHHRWQWQLWQQRVLHDSS